MRQALLISFGLFFLCNTAQADNVYKWEDDAGVVHFSTKAPHPNAKPADLPPINRGEVKLATRKLISCDQHGGINCQAGPDTDGSVICYDGFSAASARFRFHCNSPKLEIAEVSDVLPDGTFSVFVRNSKSVSATTPALFFKPNIGQEIKLEGPSEIEPFGLAEFTFAPDGKTQVDAKVSFAQLRLTCGNCSG